jgi:hypothetical protein
MGRMSWWQTGLRPRQTSATMSFMKVSYNQGGYVSGALVGLVVTAVLLVGSLAFGLWAFMSRQDYKNNSDKKAAAAAAESKTETQAEDAIKYAEEAKNPLKTHTGPDQFGKISVQYPKTWSAYIIESDRGGASVNDYFHPNVVPDVGEEDSSYSLRIQVVSQAYDNVVDDYKSEVENGKVTAAPYALPKVPDVVGTRIDGQIESDKQGSMLIFPLRNLTLKVWTESSDYLSDFNTIILPNLTFSP